MSDMAVNINVDDKVVKIAIQIVGSYDYAIQTPTAVPDRERNRFCAGATGIVVEKRINGGIDRFLRSVCFARKPGSRVGFAARLD
jgi:hypothetical protein